MAKEIERKFLVNGVAWRQGTPFEIRQGYLCTDKERTVRVRSKGSKAFLTIKGPGKGIERDEFEYEIPSEDGKFMLDHLCQKPLIEKNRYELELAGKTWEIDEFFGENAGLVVAEIELSNSEEAFAKPDWLALEVTDDPRYLNANLIRHPFSDW